ncbi:MAG: PLP-dependent aminotransferase family protein [Chloroflexota bacterium]|nr:PLP-dependent aminotransferase family protein [Chloroflexota bacterium]
MKTSLPDIQLFLRPGIIELRWGHPDLALLPVDGLSQAAQIALEQYGPLALSYGAEQGPGRLIEQLCARLGRLEGAAPPPEQMMITGGVSQGLDMLCTVLTQPGDVALVESPVYHLALRILRDHRLELMPIPSDDQGLRVDALEEALATLQRQGRQARLLYTVPTFNNPTGISLKIERRRTLATLAERFGLVVLEDDPYHELWYDSPPPPPLYNLAPAGPVVRLGSFSKVLAPGLRLGWMLAPPEIIQRCTGSGMLDSGGGVNHFTACVVAAFVELGLLDEQTETLRASYRERRDALLDGLANRLPEECNWTRPRGGFFIWLRLPPGVDSAAFLPSAEAAGVSYVPGARFHTGGGGEQYCRLAFTLLSPEKLDEGARRLGVALRDQTR